jgi:pimeloyl-ACP methyl ester carboxylesterase
VPDAPTVLTAHGLWNTGLEAILLRQRLARRGFDVRPFHYRSLTAALPEVIVDFRAALLELPPPVHLVGHSLGGLVVLRLVDEHPELPIGRIVLLGSPVNGSASARAFVNLPGAAMLFGPLADAELLRPQPRVWRHPRELGVIAGSRPISFGRLFNRLPGPNDGTVTVDETRLQGATAHLVLPVSHTGMMLAESVVRETASFLSTGRFSARAA